MPGRFRQSVIEKNCDIAAGGPAGRRFQRNRATIRRAANAAIAERSATLVK